MIGTLDGTTPSGLVSGPLSAGLWGRIEGIYAAILRHPFLLGLADGSLPDGPFRFYIEQDSLYLTRYARALAATAAKAPTASDLELLAGHAANAIAVERSLHEGLFADLGLSPAAVTATPVAPTTLAYTSYLLAAAHGGSFAEALGAVLPCYWIYWEVGKTLVERGSPKPLYQRWIATYGGEEFGGVVADVLALTDRVGAGLGETERERMAEHFVATSRYEWMFWDAAWRQERWPAEIAG